MMRILAAITGAATALAGSLSAADRAGAGQHDANGMMGMGGDAGLWILLLAFGVIIAVAVSGNDNNPSSP